MGFPNLPAAPVEDHATQPFTHDEITYFLDKARLLVFSMYMRYPKMLRERLGEDTELPFPIYGSNSESDEDYSRNKNNTSSDVNEDSKMDVDDETNGTIDDNKENNIRNGQNNSGQGNITYDDRSGKSAKDDEEDPNRRYQAIRAFDPSFEPSFTDALERTQRVFARLQRHDLEYDDSWKRYGMEVLLYCVNMFEALRSNYLAESNCEY